MSSPLPIQERASQFRKEYDKVFQEIAKVIVGSHDIVHGILTCLFVGGHALLEGVPGLGKTLLVRTLAEVLDLKFNRIQFTPDLMPSDIIGTNIINETPEGQLDRFFFKLVVNYATRAEMGVILDRTTRGEFPKIGQVMDGHQIRQWQQLIREVLVAPPVQDYAIRLVLATHPQGEYAAAAANKFIRCGASPRGAQTLVLAAKVRALLDGRYNVSFEDIRKGYFPALRHRIILNFEAQAENIAPDTILTDILNEIKEKAPEMAGAK